MENKRKKPILLTAFGGNALIRSGQKGTAEEQFENLNLPMRQIARLSMKYTVVITHGNGPQVGNLLLQQESCDEVPKMPLEIIGAQTQGQIGYMIESSLETALMESGINSEQYFATLITYVVVDENDPAFQQPTKPIGPFYTEEEAIALANETNFGLASALWTENVSRAHRVADKIEAGIVWVNCWFLRDLRTPFGGSKQSGIGRE
ncbi:hypothetical protein LCGC14_2114830, partial [marine sediment metagenome]